MLGQKQTENLLRNRKIITANYRESNLIEFLTLSDFRANAAVGDILGDSMIAYTTDLLLFLTDTLWLSILSIPMILRNS